MAYGGICGSDLHYYHEGANSAAPKVIAIATVM
jgi:threonine dehydrogenase-like Zn-dependent dehydrogenase